VAVAVIAVLVALTIPFTGGRVNEARRQDRVAAAAVTRLDQLSAAVAAVGGHAGVYPCRSSFAAVNHGVQTALAWKLHVTLGRVGTSMRHQGVMFVGPHDTIDGIAAPIKADLTSRRLLASVGAWRVYRVTKPGADQRCVGG
jgi:type II secretory pathway pseudopilin PulG